MIKGALKQKIIDDLSFAVAQVDLDHKIIAHNRRFGEWFPFGNPSAKDSLVGMDFYQAIGRPFFFDGAYAPFYFASKTHETTSTVVGVPTSSVRSSEFEPKKSECHQLFSLLVTPIRSDSEETLFLVELKDVTESTRLEQRLETLKSAGAELAELNDQSLIRTEAERREELKKLIEKHMHQTLKYNVFEIRVIGDTPDKPLLPFLSVGITGAASSRELYAKSNDNGITGYVADSGEPYICDDTENDTHYIPGAIEAKSSITVPLFFCNRVVGVCNVESTKRHAFSKMDELFLQLYAKDLAMAIHLHESISSKIRRLYSECRDRLDDYLDPPTSDLLEHAFSSLANANEDSSVRSANNVSEVVNGVFKLKRKTNELKRFFRSASEDMIGESTQNQNYACFPSEWIECCKDNAATIGFLRGRRALLVSADPNWSVVKQLETFECAVDVVHSTKAAIQAVAFPDVLYDLIISDLNPDGYYFPEMEGRDYSALSNEYNLNVYDIHDGDEYFVPVKGNEADRRERRRIHDEIFVLHKLDAFFLKVSINALKLKKDPLYLINVPGSYYDPTHIRRSLSQLLGKEQPAFEASATSPKSLLKGLSAALSLSKQKITTP